MEQTFALTKGALEIPCKLSVPDCGSIRRMVLGVHGLTGCMDDPIQVAIAEEMELFYSAVMRFDFPAHGTSPLDSSWFSVENCRQTLMTVVGYLRERFAQVEELCIFASGFGAYITLICLEDIVELPGQVRLVVQTPSVMMHENLLAMKKVTRQELKAMGSMTMRTIRPLEVRYENYKEMRDTSAMITAPIPMLILHSEDSAVIKLSDVQRFHRMNEESKLVVIPGTTHQFLEEGAWDMVLDLTRDWFEFQQVLLSSWD